MTRPLGADPGAKVHRGPAPMPWRGPSKIRDPETGLLLEPTRPPSTDAHGERMKSSRYFKVRALEIMARTDLGSRNRERLLEMNRAACLAFRQAQLDGTLDKVVVFQPEPRAKRIKAPVWEAIEWHARQIEKLARVAA